MRETTQGQCPEDKLKFYSYIEELRSSRRKQDPLTPQKQPKSWVVDPWDPPLQDPPLPKTDSRPLKKSTPRRFYCKGLATPINNEKESQSPAPESVEKQNKEEAIAMVRSSRRSRGDSRQGKEGQGPFKVALCSVLYPVVRRAEKGGSKCRIDRFHSFLTRAVRR